MANITLRKQAMNADVLHVKRNVAFHSHASCHEKCMCTNFLMCLVNGPALSNLKTKEPGFLLPKAKRTLCLDGGQRNESHQATMVKSDSWRLT